MADGEVARQGTGDVLVEDVGDQPHLLEGLEAVAVGHGDARAFLAAVLQGVKGKAGQFGGRRHPGDSHHAAFFPPVSIRHLAFPYQAIGARHRTRLSHASM